MTYRELQREAEESEAARSQITISATEWERLQKDYERLQRLVKQLKDELHYARQQIAKAIY